MKKLLAHSWHLTALFLLFALALVGCGSQSSSNTTGPVTLNLGYFPNLTHAVALVGVERGTFQKVLGSNVKLQTKDRKSTRLNSSHLVISYAVFCLKKKKKKS